MLKPLPKYVFRKLLSQFNRPHHSQSPERLFSVDCEKTTDWLFKRLVKNTDDVVCYLDGNGNFVEEGQAYAVKLQFMWSNQQFWVSA